MEKWFIDIQCLALSVVINYILKDLQIVSSVEL